MSEPIKGFGAVVIGSTAEFVPRFRVTAACVIVRSPNGQLQHAYQDAMLDWLSPEQEEHFLSENLVERIATTGAKK